jgi:RNA polymerase sigma-70 factor (ECF subfamily)
MQQTQALTAVSARRPASNAARKTSDTELMQAVGQGDKQAMQVLFGRHNVRIYRFALRFVNDEAMADDLVSEVFLEVWRQATKFEARCQVSTWLLAIARNKALSVLRRKSTEEMDDDVAEFIEDTSDSPEVVMQKRQRTEIMLECIKQLSPAHREIIDLVYYHEKTIEEVAKIIGIPLNTVKTRMFYARKRVAELMASKGVELAHIWIAGSPDAQDTLWAFTPLVI